VETRHFATSNFPVNVAPEGTITALALQVSPQRASLACAISDNRRQAAVFVGGRFDRNTDYLRFVSAGRAYQHIEYVRPHAKDRFRLAGASLALHIAPPLAL
jgi:hypothetical protein